MAKLKEYKRPQDDELLALLQDNSVDNAFSNENKRVMKHIDFRLTSLHYDSGIPMNKMAARINVKDQSFVLPDHMQNNSNRFALRHLTYQSLKANNFEKRPFLDPTSTLNGKKDFRLN